MIKVNRGRVEVDGELTDILTEYACLCAALRNYVRKEELIKITEAADAVNRIMRGEDDENN